MKLGIVGLPNVGKSTLFNSLTKAGAESANYPFCTIDPNVGVVTVPDDRLKALGEMYHSKKVTPAVIEFVDIAGLVKGASKGEGLGNQFLSNIREVDAIVHVVRCFEDPNVIHVDGSVNPLRDIETINLELIFADLEVLERRLSKVVKAARMDKTYAKELALLERIKEHLESGKMAKSLDVTDEDELALLKEYNLLTYKPVIYAANVAEDDLADDGASNEMVAKVREFAAGEHSEVFVICAQIEEEISELDDDEKAMFLDDLGLKESGLEKLIKASYHILGLMSFLTAGEDETRAWTIKIGTKAPQAAGKIHSDFERGFIKAEVVNYKDLLEQGFLPEAIINFVALLGWSPDEDREIYSLDELIKAFDYHHISKAPSVFDYTKLKWMNGEYIKAMDFDKFYEMALPHLKKVITKDYDLKKIAAMVKTRIEIFPDIKELIDFFEEVPEYDSAMYCHKKMKTNEETSLTVLKEVLPVLEEQEDYTNDPLFETLSAFVKEHGYKNGYVMWPLRTAVSGKQMTPAGATEIMEIIGKEETLKRVKAAIEKLS